MKEIKPITPSEAGFSLAVLSGPRGAVDTHNDEGKDSYWPNIAYTVELSLDGKVVWTGPYKLGIGHVKWPKEGTLNVSYSTATRGLTTDEHNVCRIHARGQMLKQTPEAVATEARAAAKLAQIQKVAPKLDDVCYSLLMDGSAYFDGMRFEEWASDLGYSDDSIKAKETFEACDRIGRDLNRAIKKETLAGLREWASNY
jgi:hypothetical protein